MRGKRLDDSVGRECSACGVFKPRDEFYTTSRVRADGTKPLMPNCIPCTKARNRAYYEADPAAHAERVRSWTERQMAEDPEGYKRRLRENRLRREYGLSVEDWDRLYDSQLGRCGICLTTLAEVDKIAVDHCHDTGTVRGLLCHTCNLGIGLLGDTAEAVQRAADYLKNTHPSFEEERRDEDVSTVLPSIERG